MAALDTLTDEQIGAVVTTPGLSAPMTFFMNLPQMHAYTHEGQIEYLQTCWGDLDMHM